MDLVDSINASNSNNTSKSSSVDSINRSKPTENASSKSFYKELQLQPSGVTQLGSTRSLNHNLPLHSPLTPRRTPNTPSPHARLTDPFETGNSPMMQKSSSMHLDGHVPSSDSNRDSTGYASSTSQPTTKAACQSAKSLNTSQHFFPPGMDLSQHARYDYPLPTSPQADSSATPTGPKLDQFFRNPSEPDIYSPRHTETRPPKTPISPAHLASPVPINLAPLPFNKLPFEAQLRTVKEASKNQWTDLESILFAVTVLHGLNPVQSSFVEMFAKVNIFPKNRQQVGRPGANDPNVFDNEARAVSLPVLTEIATKYDGTVQLEEMSTLLPFLPGPFEHNVKNFRDLTDKYVQIMEQGCLCILDPMQGKFDNAPTRNLHHGLRLATNVLAIAVIHPGFDAEQRITLASLISQVNQKARQRRTPRTPRFQSDTSYNSSKSPAPPRSQTSSRQNRSSDGGAWRREFNEPNPGDSYTAQLRHWLKVHRLHKYSDIMVSYSYDELMKLDMNGLESKNVTEGARKKLISIITRMRERPQLLDDTHSALNNLAATINHPSTHHCNSLKTYAGDLKDIVDSPLGPDNLDRTKICDCMDTLVQLTQKYCARDINLATKLVDIVKICAEYTAKRIPVNEKWRTLRIPAKTRHSYSSLPNGNRYGVSHSRPHSSSFKNYNTLPNDGFASRSASVKTAIPSPRPTEFQGHAHTIGSTNIFDSLSLSPLPHSLSRNIPGKLRIQTSSERNIDGGMQRPFSASLFRSSLSDNLTAHANSPNLFDFRDSKPTEVPSINHD